MPIEKFLLFVALPVVVVSSLIEALNRTGRVKPLK
jgi:hypothetical protein